MTRWRRRSESALRPSRIDWACAVNAVGLLVPCGFALGFTL
jgi:hypothetical protein